MARTEHQTWDIWLDGKRPAAMNMALDEALLHTATFRGRPLLRIYDWAAPSVSIGCMQAVAAAPASGWEVVRRPTGGGVVFHGEDVTYTVVVPAGHSLAAADKFALYNSVNRAVCATLRKFAIPARLAAHEISPAVDRRTLVCFRHPTRYDVLAGDTKVAGCAQRRTPDGVLHQGSILFTELEGFDAPPRDAFIDAMVGAFEHEFGVRFQRFDPTRSLFADAEKLVQEKYGNDAWTRRR